MIDKNTIISLKKEYFLRCESDFATLFSIDVNQISKYERIISILDFSILSLFIGKYTLEKILYVLNNSVFIKNEINLKYIIDFCDKYAEFLDFDSALIRSDLLINYDTSYVSNNFNKMYRYRLYSPLILTIGITDSCNSKCVYCYAGGDNCLKSYISFDVLKRIFSEAKKMGIALINITGGDPFSHPDIRNILHFLKENEIQYFISTKIPLHRELIKSFSSKNYNMLQLSLDSAFDETLKYMTNSEFKVYDYVKTIIFMQERGFDVKINSVATSINILELPYLTKLLNLNKVKVHQISPFLYSNGRFDKTLFPSNEQYEYLDKFYSNFEGNIFIDYKNPYSINYKFENKSAQKCSGGRLGLVIKSNGDVVTCERFVSKQIVVGNIYNSTLKEIWNSKKLEILLKPNKELFKNSKCYDCDSFNECVIDTGLCYARSFYQNGNIFSIDPYCKKSNSTLKMF